MTPVDAMSARLPTLAAGTLLYVSALALGSSRPAVFQRDHDPFDLSDILFVTAVYAFLLMGFIISTKRPGHRMGRVFLTAGFLGLVPYTLYEYAVAAVFGSARLPLADEVAWMSMWTWTAMVTGIVLVLLTYPTGHVLSRRWLAPLALALTGSACALGGAAVFWSERSALSEVFATSDSLADMAGARDAAQLLLDAAFPLLASAVVVSGASVVVRFRRSRGEERQQMKTLVFAVALLVFGLVVEGVVAGLLGLSSSVFEILGPLSILAIPIAAGIAILRYGLYEIDVVINRTLVYLALTAILVAAYLGIVVVLQQILSGVTAESDIAVAASTLAVAALFRPLRAGVQGFIDRRFYRRKYDAQHTLQAFSSRLRDEVDLDHLANDLAVVVQETMQPRHVSVWLRPAPAVEEARS